MMILIAILWSMSLIYLGVAFMALLALGVLKGCSMLRLKRPMFLPLRAFQTNTVLYTWEDWRRDNKEEFPVRYFLTETLPHKFARISCHFEKFTYWIKSHTYKRHHMLDIRGPGYDYGWKDMDNVILFASFKALVLFVEKELNGVFLNSVPTMEGKDQESAKHWESKVEAEQELKALYNWWTVKRQESGLESIGQYEEDQHMLRRLIEVRGYMWT